MNAHGWNHYDNWDYHDNDAFWWAAAGMVVGATIARPATATPVVVHDTTYYYNDGVFMEPEGSEAVIVQAPVGAAIPSLPSGWAEVTDGSRTYYYTNGVFYAASGGKYVVIPAPPGTVVPMIPAGYTEVVVDGTTYREYGGVRYLPMLAEGQTVYVVQ